MSSPQAFTKYQISNLNQSYYLREKKTNCTSLNKSQKEAEVKENRVYGSDAFDLT